MFEDRYALAAHKQSRKHCSVYKGVSPMKNGRFRARITRYKKTRHIGVFAKEEDAARAYDREAQKIFRDNASLNFSV